MKFKILAGTHVEGKDDKGKQRVYRKGDIVDSKSDLSKHNRPGAVKFEKVDEATPVGRHQPDIKENLPPLFATVNLEAMDLAKLKALAAEEEIDLKGATSKEAIIKILRAVK